MQSAFVDIGLERDAFLYVSDFFDEEEEFERIVIDKSKKGTPDAEHAAAEEVALNRVEREQRIELTQERVEPLQEVEATPAEEVSETQETARRRGRRGRRRGRWEKTDETTPAAPPATQRFEVPDTPFVAGDPSIERIIDEEETALNGEMFKDARLQERLFDQIHAVEFNMEDDFRNAEVGSILSSGFGSESFERIDDGETDAEPIREAGRPREAHLSTFIDDMTSQTFSGGGFERISDDEEDAVAAAVEEEKPAKRSRKAAAGTEKKKRTSKAATKSTASKKKASKKSSKKSAAEADIAEAEPISDYADAEARVIDSQSRGEFATRRGGRRRRRPSKNKPQQGQAEVDGNQVEATNGQDDDFEPAQFVEPQEEVAPPQPEPPQRQRREQRDQRGEQRDRGEQRGDQRGQRDQRSFRGQSRRERHQPAITDLLSEGQEILVQIAK
jgi:ribonuclease G